MVFVLSLLSMPGWRGWMFELLRLKTTLFRRTPKDRFAKVCWL
jgi:hypothetical protein